MPARPAAPSHQRRLAAAALGAALLLYVAALAWPTQDVALYASLGRALGPPDRAPAGSSAQRLAALGRAPGEFVGAAADAAADDGGPLAPAIAAAAARLAKQARKHGRLPPRGGGVRGGGVHVVATSNGSPYLNIQTRVLYASYRAIADTQQGRRSLAGFTRILHRSAPDALVGEVPTVRVDPATPACDAWCEFPVADRPAAFAAWLAAVARGEAPLAARWVALIETDYVIIKPLAPPPSDAGLVFPFGYITPTHPDAAPCVARLLPAGVAVGDVPGTGPAPALLPVETWARLTPHWTAATAAIEGDPQCKRVLGWVREMYAFSVAVAAVDGVPRPAAPAPPLSPLIAQPPADADPGLAAALHYTWGTRILDTANGSAVVWEFDKRAWTDAALVAEPPRLPPLPPWSPDWVLPDGTPVLRELAATLAAEQQAINRAVDSLKPLV